MTRVRSVTSTCFLLASLALAGCPSDGPECTTDDDCSDDKPYCGLLRA